MLDELTPDQRAKLARGWVWRPGHAAVWTGAQGTMSVRVALDPQVPGYLVVSAADGGHNAVKIANLTPDLTDPVTADGLLRTARAVLKIPSLAAVVYSENDGKPALWALQRFCFYFGPDHELLTSEGWGGPSTKTLLWKSEPAALLAAILAAPEAA